MPSKSVAIRGVVLDAKAQPVVDAVVELRAANTQPLSGNKVPSVRTDVRGAFTFEHLTPGHYLLSARKAGLQSSSVEVLCEGDDLNRLSLILFASSQPKASNDRPTGEAEEMEFSDQPHFSVAGVTDWTAAGGHGSDVTLRTSESLTSATTTLKPKATPSTTNKAVGRESAINGNAEAHRLAAKLDEERGDPLLAVQEFEQAARIDPSEENEFDWASELLQHRAIWQAERVFRKGAAAYPGSLRMQAGLGAALFAGARYEDAALELCKASDIDPADTDPYRFLGEVVVAAPKPLDCVESKLSRFVQLHPESPTANYLYAMALLKAHQNSLATQSVVSAEIYLNKAVSLDAKCSEAYLELGILAATRHDNQEAIRSYVKAIQADPQLADAHYRLGIAYDRIGEAAKAEQEFALHKQIEQRQAEATEKQRKAVKQFLFAKPEGPAATAVK